MSNSFEGFEDILTLLIGSGINDILDPLTDTRSLSFHIEKLFLLSFWAYNITASCLQCYPIFGKRLCASIRKLVCIIFWCFDRRLAIYKKNVAFTYIFNRDFFDDGCNCTRLIVLLIRVTIFIVLIKTFSLKLYHFKFPNTQKLHSQRKKNLGNGFEDGDYSAVHDSALSLLFPDLSRSFER